MLNLYMPELGTIEEIFDETSNVKTLTISLENRKPLKALPGQFMELTLFGYGEFPASISDMMAPEKEHFQITIQKIGKVTKEIDNLTVGSQIGIRGPFGNGYPLEMMTGKNICMVTGGIGLSAVKYLLNCFLKQRDQYKNIILLHGARTPKDIIYKDGLLSRNKNAEKGNLEISLSVDHPTNNWHGHVGVVTELLRKVKIDPDSTIAVVCGPSVMMKFASFELENLGIKDAHIFLSMERRMQCGMGVCGHCMIGQKRVCVDGPVFSFKTVKNVVERVF